MPAERTRTRSTLGLRVLGWVVIFNAVLAALATLTQLYLSFERQSGALREHSSYVARGFGDSLSKALWSYDFAQVELLLEGIQADQDIALVELTAEEGKSWRVGTPDEGESLEFDSLNLVYSDERRGDVVLGTLNLGLSKRAIWSDIYAQIGVLFFSNMVKTLLASMALLLIFSRLVSQHLRRISGHVDATNWMTETPLLQLDRNTGQQPDDLDAIVDAINGAKARVVSNIAEKHGTANLLQLVLDTSSSGILGLSAQGCVVSINPAARHMLGAINDPVPFFWPEVIQFLDNEDMRPLDASADPINRALAGQVLKSEIAVMTRISDHREPRYVRLASAPTPDEAGEDIRTVIIIDDVSEQEKHRQQVERASRLDALGQLTGGIAHDFNNLLATIQYAVELSVPGAQDEKTRGYLDTALNSVKRGSKLTNRLLAFAKRQPGLSKSADVTHIAEEFHALTKPVIEESISLDVIVDHPDLWVFCDVSQLENALLNLVLNSRDAIMRAGVGNRIVLKIRGVTEIDADNVLRRELPHSYIANGMHAEHSDDVERDDGKVFRYIEFAVTDNGPGMSEEVKNRSIDPFFTTKETNSGTGLGLSMVYGFIQQSDGELRIYSEPQQGTTIRMLLPRGTPAGRREAPVERLPIPMGEGRILIVEDEAELLKIMRDILDSLGYSVLPARSGREAVALYEQGESFDLLLTDIVMPGGLGGFDLAKVLRSSIPDLPVVYMSGYTGLAQSAMGDVVAPMIQKPCPPAELAAVISAELNRVR